MQNSPQLWFERFSHKSGLPLWLGIAIVGPTPISAILLVSDFLFGKATYLSYDLGAVPYIFGSTILVFYAARYISQKTERMKDYASSMCERNVNLEPLYSNRASVAVWIVVMIVFVPVYFFSSTAGLRPPTLIVSQLIGWGYFAFIQAVFIWVYGFSMYTIYKIGELPLTLKHFAQDRALGLRPFGSESLRLTAIYALFVSVAIDLALFATGVPFFLILGINFGFLFLGLTLFLLPLRSLRAKLLETRREKMEWISPKYFNVIEKLEAGGFSRAEDIGELTAIRQVLQDIQQIHTWPFDAGMMARVITVTVIPLLITVVAGLVLQFAVHV